MTPATSTLRPSTPALLSRGSVELAWVAGRTAVVGLRADSPLRLLCPRQSTEAAWIVAGSYGGGLVRGDRIEINLVAGPKTCAVLGTQATTKVYGVGRLRADFSTYSSGCAQTLRCRLEAESILVSWPDPVTCFADARYEQIQRFQLHPSASLVSVDWLTSGRMARGEAWSFDQYRSLTTVELDRRPVVHDALRLDRADGPLETMSRTGGFACLGSAWLIGPAFGPAIEALKSRLARQPIDPRRPVQYSISPLRSGAVLRFAGRSTEQTASWVREQLAEVIKVIGFDPYSRRG